MNGSIVFLALRRLRAPLIYLLVAFAVGIAGLALIPGTSRSGITMTAARAPCSTGFNAWAFAPGTSAPFALRSSNSFQP